MNPKDKIQIPLIHILEMLALISLSKFTFLLSLYNAL